MAAEGGKIPTSVSSNDAELRQAAFPSADDTAGMSLVDFCVQLDDCTPTVSLVCINWKLLFYTGFGP